MPVRDMSLSLLLLLTPRLLLLAALLPLWLAATGIGIYSPLCSLLLTPIVAILEHL